MCHIKIDITLYKSPKQDKDSIYDELKLHYWHNSCPFIYLFKLFNLFPNILSYLFIGLGVVTLLDSSFSKTCNIGKKIAVYCETMKDRESMWLMWASSKSKKVKTQESNGK